ncbi:DEAD/DEAH box helicase family protein [Candidatus Woesearchaeota archaeon]|jgi:SNF2 family DNA or RNA helicase|nr:DEAD/DEAH box helicase family protein [Candidatus Woesearchaeota archaeon]MBT4387868.1 DEAD/DEAH box helicase family protein [Candidatus Woesearchaeota archaeon]MBT4595687.1 DEAD/DEAH box helicase family protein [Candidatus Woesearchaeota archaeon]MBT5740694.1 DEAD/DEAH box helicase family protein [Candidatus Woesearchaeota archaeon]MBT6506042.1 DEAD/DEAH box helicase family protein [Candidatus Woesearchaeota archaeon]
MKKIILETKLEKKPKELISQRQFSLNVIANKISVIEQVKKLIGMSEYKDKIQILKHQTDTALRVINNFPNRALLSDEVGLGKTIEAGMIIKEYIVRKYSKKILILTPASLAYQWQEEMRSKFNEYFHIPKDSEDYDHDKIIISIDTAKTDKHSQIIKGIYWDLLIIDEAHKLKNKETLNYKFVKTIQKERCLMLTATPLQNNIFELWALVDLLHPGFFQTLNKFQEKYVENEEGLQIKNPIELKQKLEKIMIRNLRRNVDIKFVERNINTHILDFSKEEMRFYTEAVSFIKKRYQEIKKIEKIEEEKQKEMSEEELKEMANKYRQKGLLTFRLIMLTRQITSSIQTAINALERYKEAVEDDKELIQLNYIIDMAKDIKKDTKLEALLKIVKKEKKKFIIFTSFVHTQKILQTELAINGFSTVIFNGKMNAKEKEVAIENFRNEKQVLICTDAGSEGRNLQFSNILINFDLPWNPMRVEQRIGRVHRIGQTLDVQIHNMAIKDTVESYILNRLYEKIKLFEVSVGEMDLILSQLKSKKNIENEIFESYIDEENKELNKDLMQAKTSAEDIKKLDGNIFDKNGLGHN